MRDNSLLSYMSPKSQSRLGTLFFHILNFHHFDKIPISRSAAWFWFFRPCSVVWSLIRMCLASLTKSVFLPVNSPAPSVVSISGIPTSSVKSTSDLPASARLVIGTTFVNFPCVKTLAHVFPSRDLYLRHERVCIPHASQVRPMQVQVVYSQPLRHRVHCCSDSMLCCCL